MAEPDKKRSIFDTDPDEERKKQRKILIDVVIFSIVALIVTIMVIRGGKTFFEVPCNNCTEVKSCQGTCLGTCLKNGYDSVTSSGYALNEKLYCDCRCDHFLHSILLGEKCMEGFTRFGDYCCTDINGDSVCDRYNTITAEMLAKSRSTDSLSKCRSECEDNNKCTSDICSPETNYRCVHYDIVPCCGNEICEEGEKCGKCFIDCGSCISAESVKIIVETVYGRGRWVEEYDIRNQLSWLSFRDGEVQVVKIGNPARVMDDYDEFRSFEYIPSNKQNALPANPAIVKIADNEHATSRGNINEKIGYWKTSESDGILFHNFNVYCSEDIYIRLYPLWSAKNNYYYSIKYSELEKVNQLAQDRLELLPQAVKILDKCPLGKKATCTSCSYRFSLEDAINTALGKSYVFIELQRDQYAESEKGAVSIFNTRNESANVPSYVGGFSQDDVKWVMAQIKSLDAEVAKEPEKIGGVTKYYYYAGHNVSKREVFSAARWNANQTVYEESFASLYLYDITKEMRHIDGTSMGFVDADRDLFVSALRSGVSCKGIVIVLTDRRYKVYDPKLNENQLDNLRSDLISAQQVLTQNALKIKAACESIEG